MFVVVCLHTLIRTVRAIVAAPKSSKPDQVLQSWHRLEVQKCIEYNVISATNKLLQFSSPHYINNITVQPSRSTRSSTLITLLQSSSISVTQSRLNITNRSFSHATPHLWHKLLHSLSMLQMSPTMLCSKPSPFVNLSYDVFHSRLNLPFLQVFSSLVSLSLSLFQTDLTA